MDQYFARQWWLRPSAIKINTENKTENFWGINHDISRNWWSEAVLRIV